MDGGEEKDSEVRALMQSELKSLQEDLAAVGYQISQNKLRLANYSLSRVESAIQAMRRELDRLALDEEHPWRKGY